MGKPICQGDNYGVVPDLEAKRGQSTIKVVEHNHGNVITRRHEVVQDPPKPKKGKDDG